MRNEVGEGVDELRPVLAGLCGNLDFGETGEFGGAAEERLGALPESVCGFVADAREEADDAFEGHLVARVHREFQKRGDILDVGLLEKPEPARDGKRNAPFGEFHLHLHRVVVGAVEHGHLLEWDAFVEQFHYALGHERRLLGVRRESNEGGFDGMVFADGREVFRELLFVAEDRGVGDFEDLGNAAVVRLDFEYARTGVGFWKLQDVFEIRSAPRVDALGVVADHHEVSVVCREEVDEFGLQAVRVLIFIHEDLLEAALVEGGDLGAGEEKLERLG